MSELHLHVNHAPTTNWTTIGSLGVLLVTGEMDAVAAAHENHGLRRCEHVFAANRTITISGTLDATMGIFYGNRQTDTACLDLISMTPII